MPWKRAGVVYSMRKKGKDRNEYFPANKLRFKSIPGVKENKK